MAKVLYTAYTDEGKETNGFIEAMDNKEALVELKERGLSRINFLSDVALGLDRDDLEGISEAELKRIAKFEAQMQKGAGFVPYFMETMRNNAIPLAIGVSMGLYGESTGSAWWMASGVILSLALPFFSFWNYGVMQTHSALIKAVTFGEWEAVKSLSGDLKKQSKNPDIAIEADTRLASYYAHQGDMNEALKVMMPHKEYLEKSAGVYENKLGELYFHAGAYEKCLYQMKKAYEVSGENMMLADWAFAEARLGSREVAKDCLSKVEIETLPVYGLPFIEFIEGLIAYKDKNLVEAKEMLTHSLEGFSSFDKNPVVWAPVAMVRCNLALVLVEMGDRESAQMLLSEGVVKIAEEHAEVALREHLKIVFPKYFRS